MSKPILIPPVWCAIFAGLIFFADRVFPGSVPSTWWQIGLGVVLAAAGIALGAAALFQFGQEKTTYRPEDPTKTSALVTDGVYRITRNPMYAGMALGLLGLAIGLWTLLGLLLVPVFIGIISAVQIVPEERALKELFGWEYEQFKQRTPRWLFF
ncbi:methyltransferase family protein [Parvularcula maris]|uniref:Isoprenylcysteine carboxylmethyltransferase family protein n=1 Tax=Parvularcula maris TaxID=2965077 RepID=A0A9X2L7U8_9PROT|nr:isoprenylcysteine carboxylmethyltransferase family protein [Parvularcula maris]MCQ8183802.1 isoprenylcysteine carboxylmethyltransferase family protein [Parvularcula maris]